MESITKKIAILKKKTEPILTTSRKIASTAYSSIQKSQEAEALRIAFIYEIHVFKPRIKTYFQCTILNKVLLNSNENGLKTLFSQRESSS